VDKLLDVYYQESLNNPKIEEMEGFVSDANIDGKHHRFSAQKHRSHLWKDPKALLKKSIVVSNTVAMKNCLDTMISTATDLEHVAQRKWQKLVPQEVTLTCKSQSIMISKIWHPSLMDTLFYLDSKSGSPEVSSSGIAENVNVIANIALTLDVDIFIIVILSTVSTYFGKASLDEALELFSGEGMQEFTTKDSTNALMVARSLHSLINSLSDSWEIRTFAAAQIIWVYFRFERAEVSLCTAKKVIAVLLGPLVQSWTNVVKLLKTAQSWDTLEPVEQQRIINFRTLAPLVHKFELDMVGGGVDGLM